MKRSRNRRFAEMERELRGALSDRRRPNGAKGQEVAHGRTLPVDIARLAATDPLPGWDRYANCLGVDAALFFPERGEATREARAVCGACQVRYACLKVGIDERFGIWGGVSERQRRKEIRPALARHLAGRAA